MAGLPAGVAAQTTEPAPGAAAPADASGYPFRAPTAAPAEPATRIGPLHTWALGEARWVAQVDLGERVPFWIRRPDGRGPALAGTLAGGVSSRFDLERSENEFVEVHYRVGFQLRAALGRLAARAELYHASSHLGDEFLLRTGREPVSTSREAVELLLQAELLPGLLAYGGPGVLLRSTRDLGRLAARMGLEWRGERIGGGALRPFLAADVLLWEETGWRPLFASEVGVSFAGGRFRVTGTLGAGPSRAEQFLPLDETVAGLLFTVAR